MKNAENLDQNVAKVLKNNQKVIKNVTPKLFGKSATKSEIDSQVNSLNSDEEDEMITIKKSDHGDENENSDAEILQAYNDIVSVKPNSLKISIKKKATRMQVV